MTRRGVSVRRAALADAIRDADGWPLSTDELRRSVPVMLPGSTYASLRAMESAGEVIRVRHPAFPSVYWVVPDSPFVTNDGWRSSLSGVIA